MKRRILFVDDEPMVLQGLQRMLRGMREEWDMEFLDGGAKALARMAEQPVDVVVADMRMPGMNGAELLNEVMKRHPKTVRLILSGHADKDLILQCVGSTHQYLSKPCDPDALKATVLRASSLDGTLQSESLKKLVGQMTRLPSIPTLYMEIVDKANQPDAPLEDVARIIARDPGMTAKILKLVNSAFFGLRRELSSTEEAVAYIGLDTIKSLVLSLHAFSQFAHADAGGLTMESLWAHSLNVAARAKQIAQLEQADRKAVDEAFAAGMLHDIGKLVLATNMPELFAQSVRLAETNGLEFYQAEIQVLGASHADIGGYLLGLWGLPVPVVEAIALHHQPGLMPQPSFGPLTIVHAADALVWEGLAAASAMGRPQLDAAYLAAVGMTGRVAVWRESQEAQ
jgi:HD-like signal output (HDOD) protein